MINNEILLFEEEYARYKFSPQPKALGFTASYESLNGGKYLHVNHGGNQGATVQDCADNLKKIYGFDPYVIGRTVISKGSPDYWYEAIIDLKKPLKEIGVQNLEKEQKEFKYTEPVKFDNIKTRLELLPPDALIAIGQVLTHGAEKYEDRNWERGISWERYIGALLRHMMMFMVGVDTDPDSGLPLLAHLSCDALFLLSSYMRGIGEDNRWKLSPEIIDNLRESVDNYNKKWKEENNNEESENFTPLEP